MITPGEANPEKVGNHEEEVEHEEGDYPEEGDNHEEGDFLVLHPSKHDLGVLRDDQEETKATVEQQVGVCDTQEEYDPVPEIILALKATVDDWNYAKEHLVEMPSHKYARKVDGSNKRKRHAVSSTFRSAKKRKIRLNSLRTEPVLPHHCDFCGVTTHTRYCVMLEPNAGEEPEAKKLVPDCSSFRSQLHKAVTGQPVPDTCSYPPCKAGRKSHTAAACPTLMARCPSCRIRGHSSSSCPGNNVSELTTLKDLFEAHADMNYLLRKRKEEATWGFYPVKRNKKYDYEALVSMDVADALKLLS